MSEHDARSLDQQATEEMPPDAETKRAPVTAIDDEITAAIVGEDPRVALVAEVIDNLWDDLDGLPSPHEEAIAAVEALDRHDEQQGVVRVNLLKQRAIEADRDRLRGVVHAMLQAFEAGDPPGIGGHVRSIAVPRSMVEGWRLAEAGR